MLSVLFLGSLQILYAVGATGLATYGLQALILTWLKLRDERMQRKSTSQGNGTPVRDEVLDRFDWPAVTVQLPVYNELHVIRRLIDACAKLDYPSDRLQIQVLDDSSDSTTTIAESRAQFWRDRGINVQVQRRHCRSGFKAGALKAGLSAATGDFIAVFDADFAPLPDFLKLTLPTFLDRNCGDIGFVQTRWTHLNEGYSP